MRLEGEESQVPTSVWNDQLAGQGQRDNGVLVDQGRERSCRERQPRRGCVIGSRSQALGSAHPPHPTIHNLPLLYYLSLIPPTKLKLHSLLVSKIQGGRF